MVIQLDIKYVFEVIGTVVLCGLLPILVSAFVLANFKIERKDDDGKHGG